MPSSLQIWFDRLTTVMFSSTLAFTFCGLFLLPNGKTILSNLLVISIAIGLLNFFIGGKRAVGLVDRRLLFVFLGYALFVILNRFVHGDQYGVARNLIYVAVFGLLIPRKNIVVHICQYSIIVGGIGFGVLSFWQQSQGIYRVEGFTNAILFSQAAFAFVLLNVFVLNNHRKGSVFIIPISLLSIGALLYSLYLSQSRGVWLALLVLTVLFVLKKMLQKPVKYSFVGVFAIIGMMVFYQHSPILQERFNSATYDIDSAQKGQYSTSWGLRVIAWEGAWKGFLEHPLLGVGTNGFDSLKVRQVKSGEMSSFILEHPLAHTHNQYMQNLVIRGFIGLIALLCFLGLPFLWAIKKNGFLSIAALYPFTFAIYGLSDVPFEQQNVLYVFSLGLIYLWLSENLKSKYENEL